MTPHRCVRLRRDIDKHRSAGFASIRPFGLVHGGVEGATIETLQSLKTLCETPAQGDLPCGS